MTHENYFMNPIFTPEYYSSNIINPTVKALYIFANSNKFPQAVFSEPFSLIESFFDNKPYKAIAFNEDFILYLSIKDQLTHIHPNFLITTYLRNYSLCNYGNVFPEAIMGDVLIFGAKNTSYKNLKLQHYSVPYKFVEEIMTIYEKFTYS